MIKTKHPSALVIAAGRENRKLLEIVLSKGGIVASATNSIEETTEQLKVSAPDIVVLDVDDMGGDPAEVVRCLRNLVKSPIAVLSERQHEQDIILALESGADEYIVKPFRTGELIARLRTVLRRQSERDEEESVIRRGPMVVDLRTRSAQLRDQALDLTGTEFALLLLLVQNAGKVLTHRYILQQIWGEQCSEDTEYLRVFIGHLRKKTGDDTTKPQYIFTVTGIGYAWELESSPGPQQGKSVRDSRNASKSD